MRCLISAGAVCSAILLLGPARCASTLESSGEFYRGQVVDMDTGKPLAGVIVVFVSYREVYSPVTKRIHDEFHRVAEVLTDADGRFEVSALPETGLGTGVVRIRTEDPVFFSPGYFLPYKAEGSGESWRGPTIVYLKRADDPRNAVEPLPLVSSFPFHRTPLFLKALNAERLRLGLSPIQAGDEGKDR